MATTATYTLDVNEDGSVDTGFPDGDRVGGLIAPDSLTASNQTQTTIDLDWNYASSGHDGFEIEQYISGLSTQWNKVFDAGSTARFWQAAALPSGTHIGHRIRAVNSVTGVFSEYGAESWVDTIPSIPTGDNPTFNQRTRTVGPQGGQGNGTDSSPWNLQQAMDNATAGDIVGIRAGVYVGQMQSGPNDETLRFRPAWYARNSGTASNPIVFVAEHLASKRPSAGNRTDIRSGGTEESGTTDGRTARRGWPSFGHGYQAGGDHVKWIGIYSNNTDSNNQIYEDCGVCTVRGADDVEVSDCHLIGSTTANWAGADGHNANNYSGIRIEDTWRARLTNNLIENFSHAGTNAPGIMIYFSRDWEILHNEVNNCSHGFQPKRGWDNTRANRMWGEMAYNRISNCLVGFRHTGPHVGAEGQRSAIHHNLVLNCGQGHALLLDTYGHQIDTTDIYHNTYYKTDSFGGDIYHINSPPSYKRCVLKNNIYYQPDSYHGLNSALTTSYKTKLSRWADIDNNCVFDIQDVMFWPASGNDGLDWTEWRGTYGMDTSSITSDPQFVNASGGNYRLADNGQEALTASDVSGPVGCYVTGDEDIGIV